MARVRRVADDRRRARLLWAELLQEWRGSGEGRRLEDPNGSGLQAAQELGILGKEPGLKDVDEALPRSSNAQHVTASLTLGKNRDLVFCSYCWSSFLS